MVEEVVDADDLAGIVALGIGTKEVERLSPGGQAGDGSGLPAHERQYLFHRNIQLGQGQGQRRATVGVAVGAVRGAVGDLAGRGLYTVTMTAANMSAAGSSMRHFCLFTGLWRA